MKKIGVLALVAIMLTGCAQTSEQNTLDVWDVDPIYQFDDLYLDYNFAKNLDDYGYNAVFENNNLYSEFDKGSVFAVNKNKLALINGVGEIVTPFSYSHFLYFLYSKEYNESASIELLGYHANKYGLDQYAQELGSENILGNKVNTDLSIGEHWGLSALEGYPFIIFINDNGEVVYEADPMTKKVFNVDEIAMNSGLVDLGLFELGNHYATFLTERSDDLLIINNAGYTTVDIDPSLTIMGMSEGVVQLGSLDQSLISTYQPEIEDKQVMYINAQGETIASGYQDGYGFFEGLAPVKQNGKWGYIDQSGSVVIDFIFDSATPMYEGKAWVIYQGRCGKLNIQEMLDNNIPFTDASFNLSAFPTLGNISCSLNDVPLVYDADPHQEVCPFCDLLESVNYPFYESKQDGDVTWYRIAQNIWVNDQRGVYLVNDYVEGNQPDVVSSDKLRLDRPIFQ